MNKKALGLLISSTLAVGITTFAGVSSFLTSSVKVEAESNVTVYYAISDESMNNRGATSIKLNCQVGNNDWASTTMTTTGEVINGARVYSGSVTEKYGGLDVMQFQFYGNNGWISEEVAFSSWNTKDTFNNKYYIHNYGGWYSGFKTVYLKVWDAWSNPYLHVWENRNGDKNVFGDWPGLKLTTPDPNMKFDGAALYKADIPYVNAANVKFIYNDNGDHESGTYSSVTDGNYFWHDGNSWTSDSDLGKAAEFAYSFNEARMNVKAAGSVKNYSICGLDASTWVNKYNALSIGESAKTVLDNTTINTYTSQEVELHKNFKISDIMSYLGTISSSSSGSRHFEVSTSGSTVAIVVSAGLLTMLAGSYLFFRKKKIA